LITRWTSTARRIETSSGTAAPAAASASTFSSAARLSTVTTWDSKPIRPAPRRTAAVASAATVPRSTSSSTSGTSTFAWVVYRPSVPKRSAG
jgi:hypothetical protein